MTTEHLTADTTTDQPTNTTPDTDTLYDFSDKDTREDDMEAAFEDIINQLLDARDEAEQTELLQNFLEFNNAFHDYSVRNWAVAQVQKPYRVTRLATYKKWQKLGRQVKEGETAIYIWAPYIAPVCKTCNTSKKYHDDEDCEADEDDRKWNKQPVSFYPQPVFDIKQTDGDPIPDLPHTPVGDAGDLPEYILDAIAADGVKLTELPEQKFNQEYNADAVYRRDNHEIIYPEMETDTAAFARVLLHEWAHSKAHQSRSLDDTTAEQEIVADGAAYLAGEYFNVDMSNTSLYIARWESDSPDDIEDRLGEIQSVAREMVEEIEAQLEDDILPTLFTWLNP